MGEEEPQVRVLVLGGVEHGRHVRQGGARGEGVEHLLDRAATRDRPRGRDRASPAGTSASRTGSRLW